MRIEKLNTNHVNIGVLLFKDYSTPYVESGYKELDWTIQAIRFMFDSIEKVIILIEESNKLSEGKLEANCIGENEEIISFKDDFFQFYAITLSNDIYLELEKSIWISLLEKIKEFMISENKKNRTIQF